MRFSRHRAVRSKLLLAFVLAVLLGLAGPAFLTISRENAPLLRSIVEAATTDTVTLTAPLPIPSLAGVVLEQGRIGIAGGRGNRARSGDATQQYLDSGRADLVLSDAVLMVDPARFGKPQDAISAALAPLLVAVTGLSFGELEVDNATVIIRRSDGGRDVLTNVDAEIVASRKSSLKATGSLRYLGEPLLFETTIANVNETRLGARLPIVLKLKGPLVETEIDGTLVLAEQPQLVSSRARLSVLDIPKLARLFGLSWPEQATFQNVDARGKLVWAGRTVALDDAAFNFDGNEATGALSLSLGSKRPLLDATLAFRRLDAGRYVGLALQPRRNQAQIVPTLNGLFAGSEASAAPPVTELDADVRISAEAIEGLPFKLGHFATTVGLKSGRLSADVTGFEADGCSDGRAEINVDLNQSQPKANLTGRCAQLDLAAVSSLLLGHAPLDGRGYASVDLNATGRTFAELQATLGGKIEIAVQDGGRIGVSVATLAADKRLKAVGLVESPAWGQTPLQSLKARLAADSGILRLVDFEAAAGEERIRAEGTLSLPARVMDITFRTARANAGALQANAEVGAANPAPAVRVLGPWSNPFVRPASDASATGTGEFPSSRTEPARLTPPRE